MRLPLGYRTCLTHILSDPVYISSYFHEKIRVRTSQKIRYIPRGFISISGEEKDTVEISYEQDMKVVCLKSGGSSCEQPRFGWGWERCCCIEWVLKERGWPTFLEGLSLPAKAHEAHDLARCQTRHSCRSYLMYQWTRLFPQMKGWANASLESTRNT